MATVETSIQINKPAEQVFAFLAELSNQTKLNGMLTEVVVSGPLAVGARFKTRGASFGHSFETDNEIVVLEANRKLGFKTFAPPPASDVTSTYTLDQDGNGTKLTLSMDAVIMGGMPGMEDMIKKQLKSGLDGTMAAIKKALEN